MKHKKELRRIVKDFVLSARIPEGCGRFCGNSKVVRIARRLARRLSNYQVNIFLAYGIIPAEFFVWLKEIGIVRTTMKIPKGGAKISKLIKLINDFYNSDEPWRAEQDYKERRNLIKNCFPELNKASFALQDYVWEILFSS